MANPSKLKSLPVDAILSELNDALKEYGGAILLAETGAGKTTRVPAALLDWGIRGEVVVLEPRRLAARLSAERVAWERGDSVGNEVGYTVRFDDKRSANTRLRYVTTGVMIQRLPHMPNLDSVGAIIFDEFHERHLQDDLLLAWVARLRKTKRPDLKVVVMSATLDPKPVAELLNLPVLKSSGRTFPVEIEWDDRRDDRAMQTRVASALRDAVTRGLTGNALVFVPGVGDIHACEKACQTVATEHQLELVQLHGRLTPQQTRQALAKRERTKVIIATNVAESSVTLDDITWVIDTGLHNVARSSPWTGLTALTMEDIPRHSANQRAGRAGRTAPGVCRRLYQQADYSRRPESLDPEINRVDLAEMVLLLAALGEHSQNSLPWLTAPSPARWDAAVQLLRRLGALDSENAITDAGRDLMAMPLHPRLACLAVRAPELGPAAAALISEGARLTETVPGNDNDLLTLIEQWRAGRMHRALSNRVKKVVDRLPRKGRSGDPETELSQAILFAFSDRVAKQDGSRLLLADGGVSALTNRSGVTVNEWLVVVDASDGSRAICRMATAIEPDWLLDLPNSESYLTEDLEVDWDDKSQRVRATETLRWGRLILSADPVSPAGLPKARELLLSKAKIAGFGRFVDADTLQRYARRREFAHSVAPDMPGLSDTQLWLLVEQLCENVWSFKALKQADLIAHAVAQLSYQQQQELERLAPERMRLAGGRHARVIYPAEGPPRISARIQDFFGMADTPKLGGGKVRPLIELLAPNMRPAQLTDDLAGFWERTWPQVRKELRGRYPKHAWPENPADSSPKK